MIGALSVQVSQIEVSNFRGIRSGVVNLRGNALLVGGNGVGKSTVCEALDLVLGPERMFRRPVVDEYDFYGAKYRPDSDGQLPLIRIDVVIIQLSEEAQRRFRANLQKWDTENWRFVEPSVDGATLDDGQWCLPVTFLGRFNPAEDDFDGGTFFRFPENEFRALGILGDELGVGLIRFTREDKRFCKFLYLRAIRTGNRALGFGRGSLVDTIVRLESDDSSSLLDVVISELDAMSLAESNDGLRHIRAQLRERIGKFLPLSLNSEPIDVKASELTREHVREVIRLFLAPQPGSHLLPFSRLSTGNLNILVFALLTYIADLSGQDNVIFAMEEPEIALPPHTQRRMVDFVTSHMGQAIVTSHSPYIIEKFEPSEIVALLRTADGLLSANAVVFPTDFKMKRYRSNSRQFAEAVLARGVIVVEGASEVVVLSMAADFLSNDPSLNYEHPDISGITFFDAQGDSSVPLYAPLFSAMRKAVFGFHDLPKVAFTAAQESNATAFDVYCATSYRGIEDLLSSELPIDVLDRFLVQNFARPGNSHSEVNLAELDENARREMTSEFLQRHKGSSDGLTANLMSECTTTSDLPVTVVNFLTSTNSFLKSKFDAEGEPPEETTATQDERAPAQPRPSNVTLEIEREA